MDLPTLAVSHKRYALCVAVKLSPTLLAFNGPSSSMWRFLTVCLYSKVATPHCLKSPLSFTGHFGIVRKHTLKQLTPTDAKLMPTNQRQLNPREELHIRYIITNCWLMKLQFMVETKAFLTPNNHFSPWYSWEKMSEVMYCSHHYDDIFQQLVINIAFFYSL